MKGITFRQEVCRLLEYGIEQNGTRYVSQSKLIYHYWILGYTKQQDYEAIKKWYCSHNHQSKTWQTHPEKALKNASSAVNSLYKNKEGKNQKPYKGYRKQLTVGDVLNIITFTPDYRLQKFIFSLLNFALNRKDSKNEFRLPWVVITAFDCCSRESYQDKMHFSQERGLITKVKEFYRQEHRARTFKVNYTFSEAGDSVNSFENGLRRLFTQKELRSRYSRWVYDKFLRGNDSCELQFLG